MGCLVALNQFSFTSRLSLRFPQSFHFLFQCFDLAVVALTDSGTLKGGVAHIEKPEKGNHEVKRNSCLPGGLCVPSWLKGQY